MNPFDIPPPSDPDSDLAGLAAFEAQSTATPSKDAEVPKKTVELTAPQLFALLVACMSDHDDRLLQMRVFESNQEIVDLLNWKEGFEGLDPVFKRRMMGVWNDEPEVWE